MRRPIDVRRPTRLLLLLGRARVARAAGLLLGRTRTARLAGAAALLLGRARTARLAGAAALLGCTRTAWFAAPMIRGKLHSAGLARSLGAGVGQDTHGAGAGKGRDANGGNGFLQHTRFLLVVGLAGVVSPGVLANLGVRLFLI